MAEGVSGPAIRQLQTLLERGSAGSLADAQLLDHYLDGAEASGWAFAALVERHGPMVLRVCRGVLRDPADVDDAFQATFLVLAMRAGAIRGRGSAGSWLHGVALRVAADARKSAARRRGHERRAAVARDAITGRSEGEGDDLGPVLHQEIGKLPEKYRAPVILFHLEGLALGAVARQLEWPVGTVQGRLARARSLLRSRLDRRGLAPAIAAWATAAAAKSAEAVPAALRDATLSAAGRLVAGGTVKSGAVPATSLALALGMTRSLSMIRLKLTLGLAATFLLGAAGFSLYQLRAEPPANSAPVSVAPPKPATPPVAKPPASARSVRVVVLDPRGKPVPGAKIHASIWTDEKDFQTKRDYKADANGSTQVGLPATFTILRLWASQSPYVSMFAHWEQDELAAGGTVPAEYTFHLEAATSAGGRVGDEQGNPIAGARVQVNLSGEAIPAGGESHASYSGSLTESSGGATTDAQGRWNIDNVPDQPTLKLILLVTHPDYHCDENWQQSQNAAGVTTAMLRAGTATLKLKPGVIVRGTVTDPTGGPLKDALVIHGDDPYFASTQCDFPVDTDGHFRLPALPPSPTTLTVIAPGWAPQVRRIDPKVGLPPQDFRMAPGKPVRLRMVDPAGKPIRQATIDVREWEGAKALHNHDHSKVHNTKIPRVADADGLWEWTWAPNSPVKLEVYGKSCSPVALEVRGGDPDRTVVLKPEHRLNGRVTDATTGRPIPAFTVIPVNVFRNGSLSTQRGNSVPYRDGRLDYLAHRNDIGQRLRIEATGYRSQDGPAFRVGDDSNRIQNFQLLPSPPRVGTILGINGQPSAGVEVVLATPTQQAEFSSDWGNQRTSTDAAGRFAFPDPGEPYDLIARGDQGFAFAERPANPPEAGALQLRSWASVHGQFRDGGRPVREATLLLQPIRAGGPARPRVQDEQQVVTDADGRFAFDKVPPGPIAVQTLLGPWQDEGFRSGPSVPIDLQPGQAIALELGGGGAIVSGKVALKGNVPDGLNCTYSLNYLVRREPGITPPPGVGGPEFDIRRGWQELWTKTVEGLVYRETLHYWFVKLAPDGSFRISGVPAGEYDLAIQIYAKPEGCLVDPLAHTSTQVTITADDETRGELALPEIPATVAPAPSVGDTPALLFQQPNGPDDSLANHRGHPLVVQFWASWCGPCKQQIPALQGMYEKFAPMGLEVLSLSLDDDAEAWRSALKTFKLPWCQGRLGANAGTGVSSVPAYWILDSSGKITARANTPGDLEGPLMNLRK